MRAKIGQLFIVGIQGPELETSEAEFIIQNNIGGVILFARNLVDPKQIYKLCSDIHALKNRMPDKAPLFISIDMEGGRVHRLQPPFTKWPALRKLGDLDSTSLAFRFALDMGAELGAFGINMDYAPCIDILTNPKNTVIGDRALGTEPEIVSKISSALVRGYIKSGILPVAKHFPGHGNTLVDSHDDLPIEDTDFATLDNRELIPFKRAMRARLDLMMTAHIKYPQIDSEWPVTLSKIFLQDILRGKLRYKGLIMSDDLDMKAMRRHFPIEEIPVRALEAGCNILLYCNEPASPPIAIKAIESAMAKGTLPKANIEESYKLVLELKKETLSEFQMPPFEEAMKIINNPEHKLIAEAISTGKIPKDLKT